MRLTAKIFLLPVRRMQSQLCSSAGGSRVQVIVTPTFCYQSMTKPDILITRTRVFEDNNHSVFSSQPTSMNILLISRINQQQAIFSLATVRLLTQTHSCKDAVIPHCMSTKLWFTPVQDATVSPRHNTATWKTQLPKVYIHRTYKSFTLRQATPLKMQQSVAVFTPVAVQLKRKPYDLLHPVGS